MHTELGGYGDPGNPCGDTIPQCDCPGVCAHECGKMRAETHACVGARACVRATPCVEETLCVSGVGASVQGCVLPSTPCMNEAPRVREAACVSERPCVRKTACVRSLCVREMTVGMREHAAASPGVSLSVMECSRRRDTRERGC